MHPAKRSIIGSSAVLLGAVAVLAVVVWPIPLAARILPVTYLVAFRVPLMVILGCAAIAVLVLAVRRRAGRAVLLPVAAALALSVVASGAVLVDRGSSAEPLPVGVSGSVRILSWNTEHAAPGGEAIAELIHSIDADIAVLPETDADTASDVAASLVAAGHTAEHDTVDHIGFPGSTPTSVIFVDELADAGYRLSEEAGSTPGQPSGIWEPTDAAAPVIGAVHTVPPTPWGLPLWTAGLEWVATQCERDPRVIIAGDLNATTDHMTGLTTDHAPRRCRDAATASAGAARGTWPSSAPEWLASPIDHVLAGAAWDVVAFDVLDTDTAGGSDHRAVVADLRPTREIVPDGPATRPAS